MTGETQAGRNAEGFFFLNTEDAALALKEKKQVEYLESHLDYRSPEQVLALYERMLRERVFRTPVGTIYLKHLQDFLLLQPGLDPARIPMIPVYSPCVIVPRRRERPRSVPARAAQPVAARLRVSVIVNVLLAAAVAAMFAIAVFSDQPNILNYRTAILNEYASWQQDLTEREKTIRERERAVDERERELDIMEDLIEDLMGDKAE